MTLYWIDCTCGKHLQVRGYQAGTTVRCGCGRVVDVPPLSELAAGVGEPPAVAASPRSQPDLKPPRLQAWLALLLPLIAWFWQVSAALLVTRAPIQYYSFAVRTQGLLIFSGLFLGIWALVKRGRGGLAVVAPAWIGLVLSAGTVLLIGFMILVNVFPFTVRPEGKNPAQQALQEAQSYRDQEDWDAAILAYTEAIRLDPDNAVAYHGRGFAYHSRGDFDQASADYTDAVRLEPKYPWLHNSIAWLLATCPDEGHRDGMKAIQRAKDACDLAGWREPTILDTLAAAYAEAGDFQQAIKWQRKALEMASQNEKTDFQSRLDLYKSGKPYREQPNK